MLILSAAALAVATYALLYGRAKRLGAPYGTTLLALALLGLPTFELWVPRPQVFAYFLLALELWLLERWRHGDRRARLWFLPLLLIWANLHASVLLGLVVLLWHAASASLQSVRAGWFGAPPRTFRQVEYWLFALGGALVCLANPNTWRIFTYTFTVQSTLQALPVEEWRPLISYFNDGDAQAFALGLAAVSLLALWHFVRPPKAGAARGRDLFSLGLVFGGAIMPFIAVRHAGWWPILAAPALAVILAGMTGRSRARLAPGREKMFFAIVGSVFLIAAAARLPRVYYNPDTVPVPAADFLAEERLAEPFFNVYNHGGYLMWRLGPEEKVFIDGRSEVFAGRPVADYLDILHGKRLKELVDDSYHLNYFILPYRPADTARALAPLYSWLIQEGWALVWWDDAAVVLARPAPANAEVIRRRAVRRIGPWTDPRNIPAGERGAAAAELQALLDRIPDSKILRIYGEELLKTFRE
jgi:hypothetical protein